MRAPAHPHQEAFSAGFIKAPRLALAAAAAIRGRSVGRFRGRRGPRLAAYSPGVTSGKLIQIPINAWGNSASIIGLLNPAFGNTCVNA